MGQAAEENVGAAQRLQIGAGVESVQPTTDFTRKRYRENRHWRLAAKEYIYHAMTEEGVTGKRVLDFGCGTGEVTTQLALLGAHVTGLDVLDELMDVARRQAELDGCADRCDFVTGAIETVGFPPNTFDFIVCNAVLHHVDLTSVMPALMACLKPGGLFLLLEPIAYSQSLQRARDVSPVKKMDLDPGERQLTRTDINYITSYFTIVGVRYFRLFERLSRLTELLIWPLMYLDWATLSLLPILSDFAGTIVVVGRKRNA